MFKTIIRTTAMALSVAACALCPAPAFGQQGGFKGPGPAVVTVKEAQGMRDDAKVTLQGHIIQHLGGDKYMFKDATGTIRVEIDDDVWRGQTIAPDDLVEIHGEVDKDWNSVEIEVKRIAKK